MKNSELKLSEEIRVLALNTSISLKSILEGKEELVNEISTLLSDIFYEFEKCNKERKSFCDQLQFKIEDNHQLLHQYKVEKNLRISADNKLIDLECMYNDLKYQSEDKILSYKEMKENIENKLSYYIKREQISSENYFNIKTEFDKLLEEHHRLRVLYLTQVENYIRDNDQDGVLTENKKDSTLGEKSLSDRNITSQTLIGSCSNFSRLKRTAKNFKESLMEEEMDFEKELKDSPGTRTNIVYDSSSLDSDVNKFEDYKHGENSVLSHEIGANLEETCEVVKWEEDEFHVDERFESFEGNEVAQNDSKECFMTQEDKSIEINFDPKTPEIQTSADFLPITPPSTPILEPEGCKLDQETEIVSELPNKIYDDLVKFSTSLLLDGRPPKPRRSLVRKNKAKKVKIPFQLCDTGIVVKSRSKPEEKPKPSSEKPKPARKAMVSGENTELHNQVLMFEKSNSPAKMNFSQSFGGSSESFDRVVCSQGMTETSQKSILVKTEINPAEINHFEPQKLGSPNLGDIRTEMEKILFENKNLRDSCTALTTINRELNHQMENMNSENEVLSKRIESLEESKNLVKAALKAQSDQIAHTNKEMVRLENKYSEKSSYSEYELISVIESRNNYKRMLGQVRDMESEETKKKTKLSLAAAFKNLFRRNPKGKGPKESVFWDRFENNKLDVAIPPHSVNVFHPFGDLGIQELPATADVMTVTTGPIHTEKGIKIFSNGIVTEKTEINLEDGSYKIRRLNQKLIDYHRIVENSLHGMDISICPYLWLSSSDPKENESKVSVIEINKSVAPMAVFGLSGRIFAIEAIPGFVTTNHINSSMNDRLESNDLLENQYFAFETEIYEKNLNKIVHRFRTLLPTVWIGRENGRLNIMPAISDFSFILMDLQLPSAIHSIKYVADRVFVGTSNSGLLCFFRGDDNQWSPRFASVAQDESKMGLISTMVAIGNAILWASSGCRIFIIDCEKLICYNSKKLANEEISNFAWCGDGVWASFLHSPFIRLYNCQSLRLLQEINVCLTIPTHVHTKMKTVQFSSLKIFGNMLWLGHFDGLIQGFRFQSRNDDFSPLMENSEQIIKHTETIVFPATFFPRIDPTNPFILPMCHDSPVMGLNGISYSDVNIDSVVHQKNNSVRVASCGNGYRDVTAEEKTSKSMSLSVMCWNWSFEEQR